MNTLRHHMGRFALLLLTLLAVTAQGMVPAGFMPGKNNDGATIVICTSTGPATIAVGPEHNPMAGADDHAASTAPHCPFAPVLAYDARINPPDFSFLITPARVDAPVRMALAPRVAVAHVYLAQGPPSFSA